MPKTYSQPSVMSHSFNQAPTADVARSTFSLDHGYKTAFNAGDLIPILCQEALPGDTFNVRLSSVARLATPLVPIMDNMRMDFFFFAVPNRLLWENWERFMGQQDAPGDSTDYVVPQITAPVGGWVEESLYDYMGLPIGKEINCNALHPRAYALIYNEWFRDENLQNPMVMLTGDGPDTASAYGLRKRGKRRDYFTSALPWPQKGDAVDLPLGDSAPVSGIGHVDQSYTLTNQTVYETDGTATETYASGQFADGNATFQFAFEEDPNNPGFPNIRADLSNATAATINSLREAFQLQKMLERDARGGTRYTEIIRSHFRVVSPDARLQRPEYLGGGSTPVVVQPIAQTTASNIVADITPQGHLAAIGYSVQSGVGFTKSFVEHSVILGLVSVRADLTYQQGMDRMWSRQTKYDFYWPALRNLGEQEVLRKEIFASGVSAEDDLVFGYQERWAEYRHAQSRITGVLRSDATASLDNWHLSQDFAAAPVLNNVFIEENPPVERIVAVTDEPQFIFDGFYSIKATRPLPTFSVPGMIDHF